MLDAASFVAVLLLLLGVVALAVFVPLVASFLLDGIVAMMRGRGLKAFALAAFSTLATALAGLGLLIASREVTHDPAGLGSTEEGLSTVLAFLAPAMCVLGVVQAFRRITGRRTV